MRAYLQKFVIIMLTVGFLVGMSAFAYAQPLNLQVNPSTDVDVYEISINNEVVMRLRSLPQGLSAYERCNIVLNRINMFVNQGNLNTDDIKTELVNGMAVLTVGGQVLATVTNADLQANNSTAEGLLEVWQNNLKRVLTVLQDSVSEEPITQPETTESAPPQQNWPDIVLTDDEQRMLELVNQERVEVGLPELELHPELVVLARMKSQDMIDNRYFAHQSPVYGSLFDMLRSAGITYTRAGENLAGSLVVERAHANLMNSPGHRANILNRYFTYIGIGIIEGGPFGKMFTQMFIRAEF